jgi:hypothetical protein
MKGKNKKVTKSKSHVERKVNKKIADIEIEREKCRKYLLYISVSVVLVVQNTTAVKLFFCFSRNRRTVPE